MSSTVVTWRVTIVFFFMSVLVRIIAPAVYIRARLFSAAPRPSLSASSAEMSSESSSGITWFLIDLGRLDGLVSLPPKELGVSG